MTITITTEETQRLADHLRECKGELPPDRKSHFEADPHFNELVDPVNPVGWTMRCIRCGWKTLVGKVG